MFGWLKTIAVGAAVGAAKAYPRALATRAAAHTAAVCMWRRCVKEAAIFGHPISAYSCDWDGVGNIFFREIKSTDPTDQELEAMTGRYEGYVRIFINEHGERWDYHPKELEQVGEFIAVAVLMGLEDAILFDTERANLVYDILPGQFVEAAGFPLEHFNAVYFKCTGKKRIPWTSEQ